MAPTTTLRVFRWREDGGERFDEFDVDTGPETTVLDALVDVQRSADSTLAFRYACRVGMCGSCAMVVNGRERWACRTRLAALDAATMGLTAARSNVVTVRPLYHFPLIRDLVVDMTPFRQRMADVRGALVPSERGGRTAEDPHTPSERGGRTAEDPHTPSERGGRTAEDPHTPSERGGHTAEDPHTPSYAIVARESPERQEIDEAIECIGCGMCLSACTMVAHNERFPGPAALNRAFTLQRDHRDAEKDARWAVLLSDDALARCHGQGNCTEVCPMDLEPTTSIQRLRRMGTRRLFGRS
jgi:fumarate reductase iron-sulfur subunit